MISTVSGSRFSTSVISFASAIRSPARMRSISAAVRSVIER
jgi:hypothetical protein